ncbi:formate dehydrogenase accessory protein FdhE [Chloroflexota bacterium]
MTTGTESEILKRLEEWESQKESPPKPLEFYRQLLSIQLNARRRAGIPDPGLSDIELNNRLMSGNPMLTFADLSLDWSLVWDVFQDVATLCSEYPEVLCEIVEKPDSTSHLAALQEATETCFHNSELPPQLTIGSLKEVNLEFVVQASLRPFLLNHCQALLGRLNQEHWRRGYCPVCGGSPDFAFLDKDNGARWLLCSRCDAQWLFHRLECPHCGTQEPGALSYFSDDQGLYRLYVCDRCRHYLKAIDLRQANSEVLLSLERFLSLDLDIQAHQNGFSPSRAPGNKKQ